MLRWSFRRLVLLVLGVTIGSVCFFVLFKVDSKFSKTYDPRRSSKTGERVKVFQRTSFRREKVIIPFKPRPCSPVKKPLEPLPAHVPLPCASSHDFAASPGFCNTEQNPSPFLVILVLSAAKNYGPRQFARTRWLRSTFGSPAAAENKWKYFFVVGVPRGKDTFNEQRTLDNEKCHFRDIIQVPVEESYHNVTQKVMSAFQWLVGSTLNNFKFVLKTDDDSLVQAMEAIHWLEQHDNGAPFYGGKCVTNLRPDRNPLSRWHLPEEVYAERTLPPVCYGAGYFLSKSLLVEILETQQPKYGEEFHLEDVYMGIRVAETKSKPQPVITSLIVNNYGALKGCSVDHLPFIVMIKDDRILGSWYEAFLKRECPSSIY